MLLATTLVLLLFVGQTVIFLLRLVAADRRSEARRRPLRSQSKTVGELEDEAAWQETGDPSTEQAGAVKGAPANEGDNRESGERSADDESPARPG